MSDPILFEINDGIALITLNRPDRLNVLNYALIDHLMAVLDTIEIDTAVRAVILTGAGERAFSAGADIHEFSGSVQRGRCAAERDFVRRGQAMTARLEAFRKPVIAAVNGLAFGGGCEITEAVHLAIASERARFAKPEINLGMPPTFGGTQRLPRLTGRKRARELAARIIRHSPLAVGGIITAVTRGLNMGIDEGLQVESEQFAALVPSGDLSEGLAAWIERRPPVYAGR
jgi:enoyl-CoA hydratase/carnithine racemase